MADPKNAKTVAKSETKVSSAPDLNAAVVSETAKNPMASNGEGLSSVGAELHPDAVTKKVDGMVALEAGGDHPAAAPQPTPAEVVLYPSTGGLPDTGPNSKYARGERSGPELFNREGQRVNRDGQLIDDFGDRIPAKGEDEVLKETDPDSRLSKARANRDVPKRIKEEMEAGKKALGRR